MPQKPVMVYHPFQKENPALRGCGLRFDTDKDLRLDILVREIEVGLLYLDCSHHIKQQSQLEARLEYMKGTKEHPSTQAQIGRRQYLAFVMDHPQSHTYIPSLTLLTLEYNVQLVLLNNHKDFTDFLTGLFRQGFALAKRTA